VDQIGKSVHDAAMAGGDGTPNRRNVIGNHPKSFIPADVDPIPASKEPSGLKEETAETVKADEKKAAEEKKAGKKEEEKTPK